MTSHSLPSRSGEAEHDRRERIRLSAAEREAPPLPDGHRTPFGWAVAALTPARRQLVLSLPQAAPDGPAWLRLTVAFELWGTVRLRFLLSSSRRSLGTLLLDFCDAFEVLELPLSAEESSAIGREGLCIELDGDCDLILFSGADASTPVEFSPHLLASGLDSSPVQGYFERMRSTASIQQFGWKEGCVLDGLLDLDAAFPDHGFEASARDHLSHWLDAELGLRYEDPWGRIADGAVYGIEGVLPFAAIARLFPGHSSLSLMDAYLGSARRADGTLYDEDMVSAEGSYTIAYPLALLGMRSGDDALIRDAVDQLRARTRELVEGDALWLRSHGDGGKSYRNWIRAYTWYLLGLIRVIQVLPASAVPDWAAEEFRRVAGIALSHQQPDGLWRVFIDDPSTEVESSGSAGIAAALAMGVRAGLLPASVRERAELSLRGLLAHLRPDGMLAGASQANKDGERLQRAEYRIISQMGMGLVAQLIAALSTDKATVRPAR